MKPAHSSLDIHSFTPIIQSIIHCIDCGTTLPSYPFSRIIDLSSQPVIHPFIRRSAPSHASFISFCIISLIRCVSCTIPFAILSCLFCFILFCFVEGDKSVRLSCLQVIKGASTTIAPLDLFTTCTLPLLSTTTTYYYHHHHYRYHYCRIGFD